MKQFDVYVNTDRDTNKIYPYFVDIQNGILDSLNSRVVIPLTPADKSDRNYHKKSLPDYQNKETTLLLANPSAHECFGKLSLKT